MKLSPVIPIVSACALVATAGWAQTDEVTAEDLLQRLKGVAPTDVLENATLLHIGEDGDMHTVKEGSNGWTCMYPGGDPMCADAEAVKWAQAYMGQETPPDTLGFVYMLLGDEGASNVDPYAEGETADNAWVRTGPHVMVVGSGAQPLLESYPSEVPEGAMQPWVMWPDTPYAHLMIPIE
ncbi:hypothetical protein [Limimaricola pyoseonensis]|uniref:Uncharacterized protein n=1 Tax=Limimaricola pyoseonensis TaxID=521013 RepID=A0A1G7K3V7_9RHOB|nr:hypothetical protein [Limimaricola pyoseonensis]SDF31837.1 hypothetical protein SAMN04488567_0114 [Limimaricola pyoseonensis]